MHSDNAANNLTTTEEGFFLDGRQGKVVADRLSTLENAMQLKYITHIYLSNNTERTVTLEPRNVYVVFAWNPSHESCTGMYLVSTGSSSQAVKTILASEHITTISVSGSVLTVAVDGWANGITVFKVPFT